MRRTISNAPKVSIIMPVFNGGHYFELALKSALAQTYLNTEIVIVNDGSTDGNQTASLCERYAARHPNIKYVHQDNKGVGGALNTALTTMTGDIFTWLSHDDLFEPHKTIAQANFFRKLDRPDVMLFSDWYAIGPEGEILQEVVYNHQELAQAPRLALLTGKINGITLFIPRYMLEEFGGFDEDLRFVQDYNLWHKIIDRYDFIHMRQKLIRYRLHPGQDSHKPGAIAEGEDLWRRMIDGLTEVDRTQLFGSSQCFFDHMAAHFATSPYPRLAAYLKERTDRVVERSSVSVVLVASEDTPSLRRTLNSLLSQVSLQYEVLVADISDEGLSSLPADDRIRVLRMASERPNAALSRAALASRGDYVAFARAGALSTPHRLLTQVRVMQTEGRSLSYTAHVTIQADSSLQTRRVTSTSTSDLVDAHMGRSSFRMETLMVHRSEILGGLDLDVWTDDDLFLSLSRVKPLLFLAEQLVTFDFERPCRPSA